MEVRTQGDKEVRTGKMFEGLHVGTFEERMGEKRKSGSLTFVRDDKLRSFLLMEEMGVICVLRSVRI
jgi:hypothetical protein